MEAGRLGTQDHSWPSVVSSRPAWAHETLLEKEEKENLNFFSYNILVMIFPQSKLFSLFKCGLDRCSGLTTCLLLGFWALSSALHLVHQAPSSSQHSRGPLLSATPPVPQAGLPVSVSQGLRLQTGDSMPDLNLLCGGVGGDRTDEGQRRTPSSSFLSLSPELGWELACSRDLSVSALLFWVCSLPGFSRGS